MKLLLTKHGNVLEKEQGNLNLGTLPGTLSPTGKKQAEQLAWRLKNEPISAIYSSDLARSADTAKIIARYHPQTPLCFAPELRERHLGIFQGKSKTETGWDQHSPDFFQPPQGESLSALRTRIEHFWKRIFNKHLRDTVLIVGHGDANLAIRAVIMNKPTEYMLDMVPQANASLLTFEIDDRGNCRETF